MRGGSGTLARTGFGGLCVGEAAGKPVSSATLLELWGRGLYRSWFMPRASVLGWRLPEMREEGDVSPHLFLIPIINV